jgi:hypothetical protein
MKWTVTATESSDTGSYFLGIMVNGLAPMGLLQYAQAWDSSTDDITWANDSRYGFASLGERGGPVKDWFTMGQLYQSFRPVSAGIIVEPAMASLSDQGIMTAVNMPVQNSDFWAATQFPTSSAIKGWFTSCSYPVKQGNGCVCYKPCDPMAEVYVDYYDENALHPPWWGGFVVWAQGLAEGATFNVRLVVNYECIPKSNALNITNPSVTSSDPLELAHAWNTEAEKPGVEFGPAASRKADTSGASMVTHHKSPPKTEPFWKRALSTVGNTALSVLPGLAMKIMELI